MNDGGVAAQLMRNATRPFLWLKATLPGDMAVGSFFVWRN